MKYFLERKELETKEHSKFYDITGEVKGAIKKYKVQNGHVLVQVMHTTCGIYVNEGEERLLQDFVLYLNKKAPQNKGLYFHDDIEKRDCPKDEPENGHSHIKSALYSNFSISLILNNGELQLGRYQRILLAEFDGPCPRKHKEKRKYFISILGE